MAPDDGAGPVDGENRAWGGGRELLADPHDARAEHHEAAGRSLPAQARRQERVAARPRVVRPYAALYLNDGGVPVDPSVGLRELPRVGGVLGVLRDLGRQGVGRHQPERLRERHAAGRREVVHERAAGRVRVYRLEALQHDGPVVEPDAHVHHRHASEAFAGGERGHDRRRAAVLRKKREVAVDAAEERQVEKGLLQYLAVRDDRYHVGVPRADARHRLLGVHVLGLYDAVGEALLGGVAGERARGQHLAAPDGAVRLGDDADDVERILAQKRVETLG